MIIKFEKGNEGKKIPNTEKYIIDEIHDIIKPQENINLSFNES